MNCQLVWKSVQAVAATGDLVKIEAAGFQAARAIEEGTKPEFWTRMRDHLRRAWIDARADQMADDAGWWEFENRPMRAEG